MALNIQGSPQPAVVTSKGVEGNVADSDRFRKKAAVSQMANAPLTTHDPIIPIYIPMEGGTPLSP
jgi:hypothetical protein